MWISLTRWPYLFLIYLHLDFALLIPLCTESVRNVVSEVRRLVSHARYLKKIRAFFFSFQVWLQLFVQKGLLVYLEPLTGV